MAHHLPSSVVRLIRRNGVPVTVRHTVGTLDPVTSTRSSTELEVLTRGVFRRPVQRAAKGDPLSTQEQSYLVLAEPFAGNFEPMDGDLVLEGKNQSRVLSVRTFARGEHLLAYRLVVSGVRMEGPA